MVICGPNGGHGCAGTANHRRLQLGSWLASSQRLGRGGWAVSGHLRASSQQLLLSQQILQGFITPGTCNTRRSVERMQGSMHSHAGGVWACRRGKWAGGKCRWGRRTTGKSPRMETQNVLTCGARVFVTPVLTPPACPTGQDSWLVEAILTRVGYTNPNKI